MAVKLLTICCCGQCEVTSSSEWNINYILNYTFYDWTFFIFANFISERSEIKCDDITNK